MPFVHNSQYGSQYGPPSPAGYSRLALCCEMQHRAVTRLGSYLILGHVCMYYWCVVGQFMLCPVAGGDLPGIALAAGRQAMLKFVSLAGRCSGVSKDHTDVTRKPHAICLISIKVQCCRSTTGWYPAAALAQRTVVH